MIQMPFFKKKQYALTGDSNWSMIGEKIIGPTGQLSLQTLSWAKNSLDSEETVHHLLAGGNFKKSEVSITLPLNFFETVALTINKIPDEAVGRVLPYHLSKNFEEDLGDFIYDWLITKRQKETLQITVFLFPKKAFTTINNILTHYKLSCISLEPDIFAVTAYLEKSQRLAQDEATLCAMLWANSMSIMVYDNETLPLARNIDLTQPGNLPLDTPQPEIAPAETQSTPEDEEKAPQADPNAILADFLVMTKESDTEKSSLPAAQTDDGEAERPAVIHPQSASWDNYCSLVGLELMRTRDYFNSIIKGNPIKTVIIGGAELFWDKLAPDIEESLNSKVEAIIDMDIALKTSPSLTAMGIGSLCR